MTRLGIARPQRLFLRFSRLMYAIDYHFFLPMNANKLALITSSQIETVRSTWSCLSPSQAQSCVSFALLRIDLCTFHMFFLLKKLHTEFITKARDFCSVDLFHYCCQLRRHIINKTGRYMHSANVVQPMCLYLYLYKSVILIIMTNNQVTIRTSNWLTLY